MGKIICMCALFFIIAVYVQGAEYYVSTTGSDKNLGTKEMPFQTIQKAADIMMPGDICYVRGGTYRETVQPKHRGMGSRPIRYRNYPGEIVTLSGTEPVIGRWTVHNNSIYKKKVDSDFIQLFADKEMMIEARWPNIQFKDMLDSTKWAFSGKGSGYGKMIDPELAKTDIDWTGAEAMLNVAKQFFTWTRTVRSHSKGRDTFEYDRDMGVRLIQQRKRQEEWEDDRYYLFGKLEALDAPTEWFLDRTKHILYLWTPNGDNPENYTIEIKTRNYAFDVKGRDYIEIYGFHFFGAAFRFEECNYCIVDNCHLLFPTHSNRVSEMDVIRKPTPSTIMSGSHNILRNSSLAYSSTGGINIKGPHNTVENCLVHDFCWMGTLMYKGIGIYPGVEDDEEGGCVVRGCTVFNSGYGCISFSGPGTIIEYNDVHDGGFLSKDVQLIGTALPSAFGSVIRYNWVHDCRSLKWHMGLRGDDQTRGITIDHNVVWNCGWASIAVKGDYNQVYNITVLTTSAIYMYTAHPNLINRGVNNGRSLTSRT